MAPSTPPPPSIRSLAALTMASTSRPLMSPKTTSIEAMAVTASPERLRQEDAAGARRIARNGPEDAVPVALVETGRLEADRVEERRRAAAPAPLVLGELEEAAAHATPPELLRQEEQVDEEDAERGVAGDAAERRVRLRVARDDVERPAIRDPALLPVVARQALGDHLLGGRVARVVDGEDGRLHRPFARPVTRRPALMQSRTDRAAAGGCGT